MLNLESLGEDGFLKDLPKWLLHTNRHVRVGIGDDALVLDNGIVVTSDSYEEGVHFSSGYFSPRDIGFKSAGATLSDLAAMGAEPICLLVNLFCSRDLGIDNLKSLYAGMEEVSSSVGAQIAGGDTVASEKLILSLTALGKAPNSLLRSGAKPGDSLYLSGFPGLSAVGHTALATASPGFPESKEKHLRPKPRVSLGIELRELASSAIDTSDGISTDAAHLAHSSGIKLIIEQELLPAHPEILLWANGHGTDLSSLMLNGGEDYELLFTSSAGIPSEIAGSRITRIGRIEEGEGVYLEIEKRTQPLPSKGYDHFKKSDIV